MDILTLGLESPVATPPANMVRLARTYAARWQWVYQRVEQRRDLFSVSWRAIFTDRAGAEHERTIEDLRMQGKD